MAGSAKNKNRNGHGSNDFSTGMQALRQLLVHSKGSMALEVVCPETIMEPKHGQQMGYLLTIFGE